jgi:hypothetical protein
MRTVVVVLPEADAQLRALGERDRQLEQVAREYIARLRLQPDLGQPVERGYLNAIAARRIRFGRDDRPGQLFGEDRGSVRRGDQDPSDGPAWRIVYTADESPKAAVRLVVIASVGVGHAASGHENAYQAAERVMRSRKEKQ